MKKLKVPDPISTFGQTQIQLSDKIVDVLSSMVLPRVVVLGNFLSNEECEELINLAKPKIARSTVMGDNGSVLHDARTSMGMFFQRGENDLCLKIERRIAELLKWPICNGEGMQVLWYGPGAEYKPHYDYFDPAFGYSEAALKRAGQRVATLIMYLNTPEQGGGTIFPDVGFEAFAQKGNAVFFSYDIPHASTKSLHGGSPVLKGEKWAAVKWIRQLKE